nr:hypothetical protein CFP56_02937 [Quercus suber]
MYCICEVASQGKEPGLWRRKIGRVWVHPSNSNNAVRSVLIMLCLCPSLMHGIGGRRVMSGYGHSPSLPLSAAEESADGLYHLPCSNKVQPSGPPQPITAVRCPGPGFLGFGRPHPP